MKLCPVTRETHVHQPKNSRSSQSGWPEVFGSFGGTVPLSAMALRQGETVEANDLVRSCWSPALFSLTVYVQVSSSDRATTTHLKSIVCRFLRPQ